MVYRILLISFLVFALSGCATTSRKKQLATDHIQELQDRVTKLEEDVQKNNELVYALKGDVESARVQTARAPYAPSAKNEPAPYDKTHKNIQIALKNANLYDGEIDGKIGKKTRAAIREFQRLNGLTEDGVAGRKTWAKLKEFLY